MFSSNNSSRESSQNYPTQWALNPSAYQNVSNEQVDWAALAQQWIMMKESAPPSSKQSKEVLNEGGEAPMDVENDKDDSGEPWSEGNDNARPPQDNWNWQQWGPWPGGWNEPLPPGSVVPPGNSVAPVNKTALLPTPYSHFVPPATESSNTSVEFPSYDGSTSGDFSSGAGPGGYWSNSGGPGRNKHPIKGNRMPRKGFPPHDIRPSVMPTETVTLDAAKRRSLPAWIREGLEKMEREKQKHLDKERERVEREEYLSRKKEEKKGAMELLKASDGSILPPKSKFDSDSGDSAEEDKSRGRTPQQKSRRRAPSPRSSSPPLPVTEEDKMLWVRRTMTEILLQVTSSEIDTICQEELNRYRSRLSAKKGGRPVTSGASPTTVGSLGLGIYGGGSSDSDSDSEANNRTLKKIENDKRSTSNLDGEELGSFSRRHQPPHKDARRRTSTSNPSKREPTENRAEGDAQSDNSIVEEGSDSQVDTRPHGSSSQSTRSRGDRDRARERDRDKPRHRTTSSEDSSSSDSEHTSSDKSSNKKKIKTPPKIKPAPRSHHRSSSSRSENNDSSSDSSDKRGGKTRSDRRRRSRSEESDKRSVESNGRRKRSKRSASTNSGRESRRRTESRATVQNDHRERERDRPRREKTRSRTRSRSRTPSRRPLARRRTRSRSRSRDRRYDHRINNRRRSRTRSRERERDRERERRDPYRGRRRSRSRSRSRTKSRSRSGGKRRGY